MHKGIEGYVIHAMKYRESGRLLKVFTKQKGFISVMAQNVFKKNSGLASQTEPFVCVRYDLDEGRNLYYLRSAEIIAMNMPLRRSYDNLMLAHKAAKWLWTILPEEEPQESLYALFQTFLEELPKAQNARRLLSAFFLQGAQSLGYSPMLSACSACGNRKIQAMTFSYGYGGILCEHCRIKDAYSKSFSKESYFSIYALLHTSLEKISAETESPFTAEDGEIVQKYIEQTFQINLNLYTKRK